MIQVALQGAAMGIVALCGQGYNAVKRPEHLSQNLRFHMVEYLMHLTSTFHWSDYTGGVLLFTLLNTLS
ncbi:hypothetical protein ACH42_03670 [Endozoicomonas sp. (ex Bugula neritina AB1)]|nr:hypothetical protein ACH42_03670 [Endozoicomonas sp. (ex Bugula neritina AB1)]